MAFMRAVSILLVLMYLLVLLRVLSGFLDRHWTLEVINKILAKFQRTASLFSHTLYIKVFALVLLALSCLGTRGVKNKKIRWRKIYISLGVGFVLFFLYTLLLNPTAHEAAYFYILTIGLGYRLADGWCMDVQPVAE
jgi:YWFCY motif protein